MLKRLGGIIISWKDKTVSWHLNGFPDGSNFFLFVTFRVLVANPKKTLNTVASPARGLLNRGGGEVWQRTPPLPNTARPEEIRLLVLLVVQYTSSTPTFKRCPNAPIIDRW